MVLLESLQNLTNKSSYRQEDLESGDLGKENC